MRIAIISDTHFGDPMGTLVQSDDHGKIVIGPRYKDFKKAIGTNNDYLILLGDILDFSIVSYEEAYDFARIFFLQLQEDKIAKEIIYVCGNHDADLWHIVEHEVNVINPIKSGKAPRPFHLSLPGVIDDRKAGLNKGFTLPGVTQRKGESSKYAGLYFDNITVTSQNGQSVGTPTLFNFCYPNLYLATDYGTALVTHGQYFEAYWAMACEWAMKLALEDLKIGSALDLKEMVGINFPLSQLACSGVGQAGPLTKVVRQVQRDVKDADLRRVKKYLDRLDYEVDKLTRFPWYKQYLEWLTDMVSDQIKKMALEFIGNMEDTRYSEEFIHKKEVQDRFMNFFSASLLEIDNLNIKYGYDIPLPRYVIFGHTHQPIPWGAPDAPKAKTASDAGIQQITLYNAGGWLNKKDENVEKFVGAEVFIYSTEEGFTSIPIR
ncbi:MAG: metallophosphoesterase [Proteobacteria bacterium]|nr:metallophosphoesterase [Pseudomonadota bacterium]